MSRRALIPRDRAHELAESLTEGDLEYLIRQVKARVRRDEKRTGNTAPPPGQRDANAWKVTLGRDLERRLVKALGREPEDARAADERRIAEEAASLDRPVSHAEETADA